MSGERTASDGQTSEPSDRPAASETPLDEPSPGESAEEQTAQDGEPRREEERRRGFDEVDEESDDSFPASDPPAY